MTARAGQAVEPAVDPTTEPIDPDYPVTPVPQHARKSFASLAVVLLGFTVFSPAPSWGRHSGSASCSS